MSKSTAIRRGTLVEQAAARLLKAAATGSACAPVRDLIGGDNVDHAYAVQKRVTSARAANGAKITGRKIGLTSEAVQQQLGVDQPDFGVLLSDMAYAQGDVVPAGAVMQPRAEAEIAFVLAKNLSTGPLDAAQVRGAIAYAVPALEICGSRIRDWDISFGDTVADNASAGAYVLGTTRKTLAEFEPMEVTMTMQIDDEEASAGTGADCLGDPIHAVVWLARQTRELGEPLRAGQVVLSGALGPMRPVVAGSTVHASLIGLGSVGFTLGGPDSKEQ